MSYKNIDKIYLAGPMEGLTASAMTGWRLQAKSIAELWRYDVALLDPCRRVTFHERMGDDNYARLLFRADLRDIDESTCIVADARRCSGKGTGTSMELMYAWTRGKPLFLWVDEGDPQHPFYTSMATGIYYSLKDAMEAARSFLEA
jgi:nucleoside 2-deoxyribosyltransferase